MSAGYQLPSVRTDVVGTFLIRRESLSWGSLLYRLVEFSESICPHNVEGIARGIDSAYPYDLLNAKDRRFI